VTAGPYAAVVIPDASLPENTVGFSALTLRFPVWQRARARACAFFAAVRPTSHVLVREGNGMSGPGKPIMYYRILRASPRSHARYRTIESNRDAVVECHAYNLARCDARSQSYRFDERMIRESPRRSAITIVRSSSTFFSYLSLYTASLRITLVGFMCILINLSLDSFIFSYHLDL